MTIIRRFNTIAQLRPETDGSSCLKKPVDQMKAAPCDFRNANEHPPLFHSGVGHEWHLVTHELFLNFPFHRVSRLG